MSTSICRQRWSKHHPMPTTLESCVIISCGTAFILQLSLIFTHLHFLPSFHTIRYEKSRTVMAPYFYESTHTFRVFSMVCGRVRAYVRCIIRVIYNSTELLVFHIFRSRLYIWPLWVMRKLAIQLVFRLKIGWNFDESRKNKRIICSAFLLIQRIASSGRWNGKMNILKFHANSK